MKTKHKIILDSSVVTNVFEKIINWLTSSRLNIVSKDQKSIFNLPLIAAIIIGIIFPVSILIGIIVSFIFKISYIIEREYNDDKKMIHQS